MAAEYWGLPPSIVFLSDKAERGIIYMKEQDVQSELFPMISVKIAKKVPTLHMILQRNMSQTAYLGNGKDL